MTGHLDDTDIPALPDGLVPGSVAPFIMRYGTGFLLAMQKAAADHDAAHSSTESEPA
ncbi:hypothetical protein SAMN02800694_3204 [Luteibacter sp. UNCMF331Sha3.1]|uniref:hypothetical protein n=1 Tax=Luteibacter sp. UNCMF331Sha3.1 TaxID=1502760 RepID=UPI0008D1353B|nr:hypothetical protein [Luteibacter sp. UNCMF331Sha3.1]SEN32933.1 hypothetical protein SAMN02800694_3204 [Luteibacter sp. UNCMF331Sha3.1]